MPLIEELQISWKDFLAEARPAGRVIISDKRGPVAIVNNSLYGKLQDYAANHQIPLGAVVEQLREEIHRPC
jgi:hypothetical protein